MQRKMQENSGQGFNPPLNIKYIFSTIFKNQIQSSVDTLAYSFISLGFSFSLRKEQSPVAVSCSAHVSLAVVWRMDKVALEIVIISAHDLKDVTKFGRVMRTFAVLWSDSATQNSTQVDLEGGTYPTWNQKFQTSVSNHFLYQKGSNILIQIFSKTMLGNKPIGCARVPYSDILEGHGSPDSVHLLSYRITRPNGRRQGTIDLSLRFLEKINPGVRISKPEMNFPGFSTKSRVRPSLSYRQRQRNDANMEGNGQCAIGIPVSNLQPFPFAQQQNMPYTSYGWMSSSHFGPQNISSYGHHTPPPM